MTISFRCASTFLALVLLMCLARNVACKSTGDGAISVGIEGNSIDLPPTLCSRWYSWFSSSSLMVLASRLVEGELWKDAYTSPSPSTFWWKSSSPSSNLTNPNGGLHNETKEAISCPMSCFRPNPVCGVDGVTYWCGSADAQCAGVEVEYTGFCEFSSKVTGGKGVLAVQSLLLVHMIWLMLTALLVLFGVP